MFDKETYIRRRNELKSWLRVASLFCLVTMSRHVITRIMRIFHSVRILLSSIILVSRDGLVGIIDIDNDIETLIGMILISKTLFGMVVWTVSMIWLNKWCSQFRTDEITQDYV